MAECTGRWPVAGRAANRQATQEEIPLGAPGSVDRLEGQFQRKLPRAGGPSATRPRGGIGQREYWMAPVVEATVFVQRRCFGLQQAFAKARATALLGHADPYRTNLF